ncbi:hypothetical protein CMI41_03510 [Candidatus Pacearchaeota archaeon]|nr:hypothetical protein [Candidatus Pacearchaeota archaeon]|tara:strand:- start:670 stop:966 length:297 start_codon:yes stop_codon:yes gene_type:complete
MGDSPLKVAKKAQQTYEAALEDRGNNPGSAKQERPRFKPYANIDMNYMGEFGRALLENPVESLRSSRLVGFFYSLIRPLNVQKRARAELGEGGLPGTW